MYVATNPPSGWLLCDGTAVSRVTYTNLFVLIGTNYGSGDSSTTFNLPDMRGRTPIGHGTGSGLTARNVGQKVGGETHSHTGGTFAVGNHTHTGPSHNHTGPSHQHATAGHSLSEAELASHRHGTAIGSGTSAGGGSGTVETPTITWTPTWYSTYTGSGTAHDHGNVVAGGTGATGDAGTGNTGGTAPAFSGTSGSESDMQPSIVVNYIIKH